MILSKNVLYDWHGKNEWLFQKINALHGQTYDSAMIFLSHTADHSNFPYYMVALLLWALGGFIVRKAMHKGGAQHNLMAWVAVFMVLCAGFAADGVAVQHLKESFSYPRPFVALEDVHKLDSEKDMEDTHHSFPSGHASFATMMVVGLWPVLSAGGGLLGTLWIAGVCWSRIAVGMHFPADVLGGVLIAFIITLIVRYIIYKLLRALFHVRC